MNCLNCQKETSNIKFCSRSCSASYNNRITPKRTMKNKCLDCQKSIRSNRQRCRDCFISSRIEIFTLQDAINNAGNQYRASAHSVIRARARDICQKLGMNSCEFCGYSKHVEICHVKAISDYDPSTLISEINKIDNLKALCLNCHWEFDNLKR